MKDPHTVMGRQFMQCALGSYFQTRNSVHGHTAAILWSQCKNDKNCDGKLAFPCKMRNCYRSNVIYNLRMWEHLLSVLHGRLMCVSKLCLSVDSSCYHVMMPGVANTLLVRSSTGQTQRAWNDGTGIAVCFLVFFHSSIENVAIGNAHCHLRPPPHRLFSVLITPVSKIR